MIRHIYINLHKLPKIDLKNPKNAIFEFCSSVVYSLLPWQQHKQLIQLIAWLKMLKLCHMFVLYVFFYMLEGSCMIYLTEIGQFQSIIVPFLLKY